MPAVGPAWIVPARVAAVIAPILHSHLRSEERRNGTRYSEGVWQEIEAGLELARAVRTGAGQNPAIFPDTTGDGATLKEQGSWVRGLRRAAEIAGVPKSTLADRVRRGAIHAELRGNTYYVRRIDLDPDQE